MRKYYFAFDAKVQNSDESETSFHASYGPQNVVSSRKKVLDEAAFSSPFLTEFPVTSGHDRHSQKIGHCVLQLLVRINTSEA
ncbi:hypothetical protein RP20_CCG014494 [Aedes albopictus]|nr:hypothetical protein RP20_CCG014494 [Aedes albopictus]